MKKHLKKYALPLLVVGCLLLIYICTLMGITSIPFGEANRILLYQLLHIDIGGSSASAGHGAIIWDVRLPRVILGFLTGGALAVCGGAY
ncbi:iron chelate uptake ABC transporter family permease subunit, partial [Eubacterium aggregans]